jgi:hypothetical protein
VGRHLVPPILGVEEFLLPAPAVRAPDQADGLGFVIRGPAAHIRATLVPAGEAVDLTLTVLDGTSAEVLAGVRVSLRQHGRTIFSARTDDAGVLRLPQLIPGVYEVACPGIHTIFRLDLRT